MIAWANIWVSLFLLAGLVHPSLHTLHTTPWPLPQQNDTTRHIPLMAPPDVQTYEIWVREAFAAAQRSDRLGLEEAASRLIETTQVRAPDGALIPVDNTWLRKALDTTEPDLDEIANRLGALLDALAQPDPSAPDDALQRLNDLLNRPPFARGQNPSSDTLLVRFLDWLLRLLERMLRPIGNAGSAPATLLSWTVSGLALVLIIGVVGYLVLSMRRSLRGDARLASQEAPEARLTATEAMQRAKELVQSGDRRTAVRYLYLSALLWLDERNMLRYDRALTNYEYLQQLSNTELRTRLLPVIETFDRVWYGFLTLDAEGFATYQRQVESLQTVRKERTDETG